MNRKSKIMNRIYKRLHVAKRIPKQLRGYWKVEHEGKYIGYAAIR